MAPIRHGSVKLPSIPRRSLGEQIAEILRDKILLGELRPGDVIPERDTSAALGVSRTPLREALLVLEAQGLVEMAPARSPIVARPSLEEVTHQLLVQSALEALGGECACDEATNAEIDEIEALHQEMLASVDLPNPIEFFQVDMAFHEAIVASTKNLSLIKTHKQYRDRLWRARFLSAQLANARQTAMIEHGQIVEGLKRRDKAYVSERMESHLRQAVHNVRIAFHQEEVERDSGQ